MTKGKWDSVIFRVGAKTGFVASIFFVLSPFVTAQTIEPAVKAALIYNFGKYTTWPHERNFKAYKIGILEQDSQVFHSLKYLAERNTLNGKPIEVFHVDINQPLQPVHILYLDETFNNQVINLYQRIKDKPILVITNKNPNRVFTMINLRYDYTTKTLGYDVNTQNIQSSGLTYSPEIVIHGGSFVDIKDLYIQTNEQLRVESEKLATFQNEINLLQTEKEAYQKYIDTLTASVSDLQAKIDASYKEYMMLKNSVEVKDSTLSAISVQLAQRINQSKLLQNELHRQLDAIEQNRVNLATLDSQMVLRKREVEIKQQQIQFIQKEIEQKTQTIFEKETVIGMQQKFIFVVFALTILLAIALYLAFKAFKAKMRINSRLEQLVAERTIELQLSNKYFRNLFENSPVAIYQVDLSKIVERVDIENQIENEDGNFEYSEDPYKTFAKVQVVDANQATLELFGFTEKFDFISNFHHTYTAKSLENLSLSVEAIKKRQSNITYQTQRRKKNGEPIDVIVRWIVMPGAETNYSRVLVTIQDITELKRHRNRLEELVQERTNEVLELNQNLTRTNEELNLRKVELEKNVIILRQTQNQLIQTEKMASLGMLTAGIAHEINNPVNFISGSYQALSVLTEDLERLVKLYAELEPFQSKSDNPELLELEKTLSVEGTFDSIRFLISNIETGVTRTNNIIQNLMTYSRTGELQYVLFDIEKNIRDTLVLFKSKLGNRITIVEQFQGIPHIVADPTGISRVFMNIISNAIDAIPGQGTITIKTHYDHDFKQVIVVFEDTGVGISPESLRKIFDPFFTTKEVGKGTGLGMYMSYQTIERHDGRIEINSKPGQGTAVSVYLPTSLKAKT